MPLISLSTWNSFLDHHPEAHLLQTGAWGELKGGFGWQAERFVVGEVGAQVLFRKLPLGLSLAYLPRGPVGGDGWGDWGRLWPEIDAVCRRRWCIFLKVEADVWQAGEGPGIAPEGFRFSTQGVQPARTLLVDLSGSEEQVLARMKQKTRYNIRLAQKKGVMVRSSSDLETFHSLMQVTGERDTFGVHSLEYYRRAYELFQPDDACELLLAEYEGRPLGGVMIFARGGRAWYFYGASSNEHRDLMPTYLLQWEAMRWARQQGCTIYDLWGVPDADEAALEAGFTERSDGLWGVYRFKRGFGGELKRACGPWDRVYQELLYRGYGWVVR